MGGPRPKGAGARTDRPQRGRTGRSDDRSEDGQAAAKDGQAAATRKTQGAPPSEAAETPTRQTEGKGGKTTIILNGGKPHLHL